MRRIGAICLSSVCCLLTLLALDTARAQDYPTHSIRLIIPSGAGSLNDTLARLLLPEVNRNLGQSVVVDNMPGAAGILAAHTVSTAPADGYTLRSIQTSNTVSSVFVKDPGYDIEKDLAPVTILANTPILLETSYNEPFTTLPEMAAYAKANPGKLNHGLPGPTDLFALYMGAIKSKYGVKIVDVAYKNSTAYQQAVSTNEVQLAFVAVGNTIAQFKSKMAKPLAVSGDTRHPHFPDVATFSELGLPEITGLKFMIFATGGTPRPVVDKLNKAYVAAVKQPDIRPKLTALDLEVVASTPEALASSLAQSLEHYSAIAKTLGIKPE